MSPVGFRGPQACKIVGITYRQLDYWARTDLVRPSVADARGSGTHRLYSFRDLVELKVIRHLLDAGISLRTARKAIVYLRGNLGEELASASLVLNGATSLLVRSGEELIDLLRRGQGVLNIVPLAGMIEELEDRIAEVSPALAKAMDEPVTVEEAEPVVEEAVVRRAPRPAAGAG